MFWRCFIQLWPPVFSVQHSDSEDRRCNGPRRSTDKAPHLRLFLTAVGTAVVASSAIIALLGQYWNLELRHLDDQSLKRHGERKGEIESLQRQVEAIKEELRQQHAVSLRAQDWMRSNESTINQNAAGISALSLRVNASDARLADRTRDRYYKSDWDEDKKWIQDTFERLNDKLLELEKETE